MSHFADDDPTLCPDCGRTLPNRDAFVAHRAEDHPPTLLTVTGAGGIESETRFGTDPKE